MTLRSNSSQHHPGKKTCPDRVTIQVPWQQWFRYEGVFQRNPLRCNAADFSEVALPFSACGLVIGKGGAVQREIREKTGRCRRTW